MKVRERLKEYEAVQWLGSDEGSQPDGLSQDESGRSILNTNGCCEFITPGDWVVSHELGSRRVWSHDEFRAAYEPI